MKRFDVILGLALACLFLPRDALAQPSSAQASAIRANCRADYQRLCASVPPGGQASLACLEQHAGQLAPPCQQAVGAVGESGAAQAAPAAVPPMPASAGAAPPVPHAAPTVPPHGALSPLPQISPREEMFLMRDACGFDYRRLCAGVPLGGGTALRCLANHGMSLSPRCEQALMMLHARR